VYVLNCIWIRGNERGLVKGLVVWPDGMMVSHLQFVFFCMHGFELLQNMFVFYFDPVLRSFIVFL